MTGLQENKTKANHKIYIGLTQNEWTVYRKGMV